MRNLKLILAYDGTEYAGWQVQPGKRTIQGTIEEALEEIMAEKVRVTGAGRTDSGVHALGQTANFQIRCPIPAERLKVALNNALPDDVRVLDSADVPESFDARKSAVEKTYAYCICSSEPAHPMTQRFALHLERQLDWDAISAAAEHLVGRHDFAAFQAAGSSITDTVRTLREFRVEDGALVALLHRPEPAKRIVFTGDGFLYKMVRNMVGTLIEVGRGKIAPQDVTRILDSGQRAFAGPTAPAKGLTLVEVKY